MRYGTGVSTVYWPPSGSTCAIAAAAGGAAAGVIVLRLRNELGEQRDLVLDVRSPAEDDLDDLVEIEQPVRQPQIAGPHHVRAILEAGGVFVVRVDQQHAQIRPRVHDLAQDQRDPTRLAGAGRAEDREMLLHHVVDIDVGADRGVLLEVADIDRCWDRATSKMMRSSSWPIGTIGAADLRIDA